MTAFLDRLPERYSVVLCDLWGVVHDGRTIFPGVVERLSGWKTEGRKLLFVTNAPRTGASVRAQLDRLGFPRGIEDGIVSAGEAAAAKLEGRAVGFCGTREDRVDLEARGMVFVEHGFTELACAGLEVGETVEEHRDELQRWRDADILMHCLNPDRIVLHCGQRMVCAGALADEYEAMGGRVCWYGKPFAPIYERAMELAGGRPKSEVITIGDGLKTDVLGAARFGIDCVFVTGGIHEGEPFPHDFAEAHGLGEWAPVAVVDSL